MNIENIVEWFKRAVPEPTDQNKCVQTGCHLEEVAEMFDAFGGDTPLQSDIEDMARAMKDAPKNLADSFSSTWEEESKAIDHAALLDSLCDQIVTAIGVAHMFGMDISGALNEVNKSNWSKFVDGQPVFNASGKIAKGPDYKPPVLDAFIAKQELSK